MSLWRRRDKTSEPLERAEHISDYVSTGIGGWLAFLILGLIFLGPLIGASRIYFDLLSAESQRPELLNLARWDRFKAGTWCCFTAISLISIAAGLGLWVSRKQSIINRTILALWMAGPVGAFVMAVIVPLLAFGRTPTAAETLAVIISASIPTLVWTVYLIKSKRVMYTYIL